MFFSKQKHKPSNKNYKPTGSYKSFSDAPQGSPLFDIFSQNDGRMIHKWMHYFPIYEIFFSPYRNKPVNILEIGVYKGGSLQMWKQYFGDQGKIFGVDIVPECKGFEEENIKIFIGDQSDRVFLKDLVAQLPKIDIVLDDGGHTSKQQISSFEEIYPHIAPDGVYMVEDVHTNYWEKYNEGSDISFIDYAKKHIDELHAWHHDKAMKRRYSTPLQERKSKIDISPFASQTHGIHFYNGIVVFEKQPIPEPYHCYTVG